MKIKLLKKVRKRYEITRVDYVENPHSWLHGISLPVWLITDNDNDYTYDPRSSYDEAYKSLVRIIVKEYFYTHKTVRDKTTKVWYIK